MSQYGGSLLAVMSSAMAIGTAALASISEKVWWIDPAGAILISCYIIFSWGMISKSQVTLAMTSSAYCFSSAAPESRSCCLST